MPRRLLPLNALRAFDAAARHESFSKAALEIGVTNGAVSHQVRGLESLLKVALFERVGNRVKLTADGLALFEPVRAAFDLFANATTRLSSIELRGEIVLSIPPSLSCLWIVQELRSFLQAFPGLVFHIVPSNANREVLSPDVDLSIRYGDGAWPNRKVECLSEVYIFPVCAPTLLQGALAQRQLAALEHVSLLCADNGYEWDAWLSSTGHARLPTGPRHYLGNALNAVEMCASGFGLALGDNVNTNRYLAEGRLLRPFDQAVRVAESLYLITRPEAESKPAIRELQRWIRERFTAMREQWERIALVEPLEPPATTVAKRRRAAPEVPQVKPRATPKKRVRRVAAT